MLSRTSMFCFYS